MFVRMIKHTHASTHKLDIHLNTFVIENPLEFIEMPPYERQWNIELQNFISLFIQENICNAFPT